MEEPIKLQKECLEIDQKDIKTFMNEAIEQGEVPVGCVMVRLNKQNQEFQVIAKSHNLTNQSGNATTHCEINCINYLMKKDELNQNEDYQDNFDQVILFVTCEPCIMCAGAIGIMGINSVYFGCYNEQFGGNGSILSIHEEYNYVSQGGFFQSECREILKGFYQTGNLNLPQEMRHRKRKKSIEENQELINK